MMPPEFKMIDIGVNLTNKRFDKDRAQVISEAENAGVIKQIVTGTNLAESKKAFELTTDYQNRLYSTAGCHPHDAKSLNESDIEDFAQLLSHPNVVAVGECGLDFNRNFSPKTDQLRVFENQLVLAVETQKPLFLHERDAFDAQFQLLNKYANKISGGVVHCFTGKAEHMKAYLDLGLYIGITGWICDERRGVELYNNVHLIPSDRLLLETDAPYLLPRNLSPKPKSSRNLPKYLPHIAQSIAKAREQELLTLTAQCLTNTKRLFNI